MINIIGDDIFDEDEPVDESHIENYLSTREPENLSPTKKVEVSSDNKIVAEDIVEPFKGKLTGMVVGYTGHEPHDQQVIKKIIVEEMGTVGNKDIWEQEQIIVVGRIGFDYTYLEKSIEIGNRFQFVFRYMSQEDFLDKFLKGQDVTYYLNDPKILNHRGLSFLYEKRFGWPAGNLIPTHKVKWRILPPGEHPFTSILGYFRELGRHDWNLTIDEERLRSIYSLEPTAVYIGTDEFKRYAIFYFEDEQKAILECPIFGNAIYVIEGNWEELSRYTKAELLWYFSDSVTRVIHKGNWFDRLRFVLYS